MQRLYSMFPIGPPGIGLVLLRLSLASSLWPFPHAVLPWLSDATWQWCTGAISIALLIGALTPIAGALSLILMCVAFAQPDTELLSHALLTALDAAAILLLGPGAYSIDARLYGHRVLVLPPKK